MTSEKKNEIGADDSNGRVRKIRKAAVLALKESDQLRLAHRRVLHIRGVGRITARESIFFARENRCPSHAQSDRKNNRQINISYANYMKSPHCSSLLKGALLIVLLALCFGSSTVAHTTHTVPTPSIPLTGGSSSGLKITFRALMKSSPGRWRFPLGLTRSLLDRRETEKSAFILSSRQAGGRLSIWTSQKRRHTDGGYRPVIAWRVQAICN